MQRARGRSNTQSRRSTRQTQHATHETRCTQREMYAAWRTQRGMAHETLRVLPNATQALERRAAHADALFALHPAIRGTIRLPSAC